MALSGKYILEKNENLENLLKGLGVPDEKIEAQKKMTGDHTLDVDLEGKNLKMVSSRGTTKCENIVVVGETSTFKLSSGAEFQVNMSMPSDNVAKGTFTVKDKQGDIMVEFGGGKLVETFTFGGITGKRIYKKR